MKRKKLNYDSGIRADQGIRGAFTGVILKDNRETEEEYINPIEKSNIKN